MRVSKCALLISSLGAQAHASWSVKEFVPQVSSQSNISSNTAAIELNAVGISSNADALSDNAADILANGNAIASNTAAISSHAGAISDNTGAISANSNAIASNAGAISASAADISANGNAIASNTAAISSNAGDISANSDAISANSNAITSNAGAISDSAADISANGNAIASNTAAISSNAGDISANSAAISANSNAITSNAGAISDSAADISANGNAIASNTAAISSNTGDISVNSGAISSNAAAISTNAAEIAVNADAIASNGAAISVNAQGVSQNAAAVSSNTADISTNTAEISSHADAISSLASQVEQATGEGTPGTKTNPAPSCRYILQTGSSPHNGLYWLDHNGNELPYQAFCDMGRGGLELIFKVQHGVGGNAYDLWTSGGYNDEDLTHHSIFQTGDHFVSNKISSMWDDAGTYLNAVHIGAFNGNRRVNHFSFAASGTDTLSWHSKDNLVDSSYNDVLTSTQNYFGIAADTTNERNWMVSGSYGGCDVDNGWMVLDGDGADPCNWESSVPEISILYSQGQTKRTMNSMAYADTFAVVVDYDVVYSSCLDALQKLEFRARDGQYWINHAGTSDNQLVYCDMEHGGYELVFKIIHGGRVSPKWYSASANAANPDGSALWTTSAYDFPTVIPRNVDLHDETNTYGNGEHYASPFRHDAFSQSGITVDDIEVRIITAEETVKYLQFQGFSQSDSSAWFASTYLGSNSWSDLSPSSTFNYFGIAGHSEISRNWFINSYYGGCEVDAGWVCVVGRTDGCNWEKRESGAPDVMYACSTDQYNTCSGTVDSNGDCSSLSTADSFCYADMLAVFYKWSA